MSSRAEQHVPDDVVPQSGALCVGHRLNPFHTFLVNIPYESSPRSDFGPLARPAPRAHHDSLRSRRGPDIGITLALARFHDIDVLRRAALHFLSTLGLRGRTATGSGLTRSDKARHTCTWRCHPPPPNMLLVHDIALIRDGGRACWGVISGLLLVAQFFISLEILLETIVIAAMMLVVFALMRPSLVAHVRT